MDRLWREIERVRDRVHSFASTVTGLQKLAERNRQRLDELEPAVQELTTQEAIAEAVADKLEERNHARESKWRIWSIRAGIFAAIAGVILQVLRELGWLG